MKLTELRKSIVIIDINNANDFYDRDDSSLTNDSESITKRQK